MSEVKKISNWLLVDQEAKPTTSSNSHDELNKRLEKERRFGVVVAKKRRLKLSSGGPGSGDVEENELIRSPISGTYIIKDWKNNGTKTGFSKNEVTLNSIAASFVEITPQARAKLEKIPNRIGPFECKLCKVVYKDAFELAMHNCPRVVHIEYK